MIIWPNFRMGLYGDNPCEDTSHFSYFRVEFSVGKFLTHGLKMTFSHHDSLLVRQVRWNKKCRSARNNGVINFHWNNENVPKLTITGTILVTRVTRAQYSLKWVHLKFKMTEYFLAFPTPMVKGSKGHLGPFRPFFNSNSAHWRITLWPELIDYVNVGEECWKWNVLMTS